MQKLLLIPNDEDRYIPDIKIGASYDVCQGINLYDINAEESFCLLIKERKPKQEEADKVTYFYRVGAVRKPKVTVVDFRVTPTQAGSQRINVYYDKKTSDIHTRAVTLEYK